MKTNSSHFALVPSVKTERSTFDRSHNLKTTMDEGNLVPIFIDEVLPGDTHTLNLTGFGRMTTPIKPLMDNLYFQTFFFFVPSRLLWENHERFHGAQDDPGDSTDYLIPQVSSGTGFVRHSLGDYFGIPTGVANLKVNALPFRAYNLIYNEFFRDQNLQNSVSVPRGDGPDNIADYVLLKRGKRHDYFTSCLPWPQKGPAIDIPLGTIAPVRPYTSDLLTGSQPSMRINIADGSKPAINTNLYATGTSGQVVTAGTVAGVGAGVYPSNLYADLTSASAATINQLRQAFQVQRLYERDARGGTRYIEQLKSQFGVISPDYRLQRPEYLGGGSSMININPVVQTSSTDQTTPQGNLSAMGTIGLSGHRFSKSFTEHGFILGLASIRADLTYQQGLHKLWTRQTRLDHYLPVLAHIGEQAVLSKEIYCDGTAGDNTVFGYQERWAEYRYKPSIITGAFRSTDPTPLDIWHLGQEFGSRPLLGASFILEQPPVSRVVAVPSEPHFLFDADFRLRSTRVMPMYSAPGMIDHF